MEGLSPYLPYLVYLDIYTHVACLPCCEGKKLLLVFAQVVRELLDHGADINSKDWEGDNPLTLAAYFGWVRADLARGGGAHCWSSTPFRCHKVDPAPFL